MLLLSWLLLVAAPCLSLGDQPFRPGFSVIPVRTPVPSASPASLHTVAAPTPAADALSPVAAEASPLGGDPAADTQELEKFRKAMQVMGASSPMAAEGDPADPNAPVPPEMERIRKLQKMLSSPRLQAFARAFQAPDVIEAVTQLSTSPNRMKLLYAQIGLLAFLFLFRIWREGSARGFRQKLWVKFYSYVVYFVLAIGVIPTLTLGDPYWTVVNAMWKAASGRMDTQKQ